MTELKRGRYRLMGQWNMDTLGRFAMAMDKQTGNRVRIFECMNYRYPMNPQGNERLSAVTRRVDAFAERTQHIMETVNQAADRNECIQRITDFFREGVYLYMVSDTADLLPIELNALCGHMTPAAADGIVLKIARALQTLHERGLICGDIQPKSILLRKRDGVVEPLLCVDPHSALFKNAVPNGAELVGTLEYMSPEFALHKFNEEDEPPIPITETSDLFSLGVLYHQCLTGKRPSFDEEKYSALWEIMLDSEEDEEWALSSSLDEGHRDLLEAMLYPEPDGRLQSCAELIERLESMIGEGGAEEIRECDLTKYTDDEDSDEGEMLMGEDDDEDLLPQEEVPSLKDVCIRLLAEGGRISDAGLEAAYDRLSEELRKLEPDQRIQSCVELTARIKGIMVDAMTALSCCGKPSQESE